MEQYDGSIKISFEDMPSIQLESLQPKHPANLLERISIATKRRRFTLRESWQVNVGGIGYLDGLNGVIEIPDKDENGDKIVFDGASIPLPWLVSLLTIGILRPLGIMLIGSIIHDYAYKFGFLKVSSTDATFKNVTVPRHFADRFLRDIIGTVNRVPPIAFVSWFFVRVGWPFVKYNKNRLGGRIPFLEYCVFAIIIALIVWISKQYSVSTFLSGFMMAYIVFYIFGLLLNATIRE